MRGESVDRRVGTEGPNPDGAVAAAGDEGRIAELELSNQGGVALECGEALSGGTSVLAGSSRS